MRVLAVLGVATLVAAWWRLPMPVSGQESRSPTRKFAVVIGTSRYEDAGTNGLKYAHWDAKLFAEHLKTTRGGSVPVGNIRLLVNENATGTQIEKAFRWLAASVGRRDQVYIFVSGIGRATVLSKDGYILPFDRPAEKEALSLTKLRTWLQNCCSLAEVYLFADACREQPVFEDIPVIRRIPLDNKINYAIRSLADPGTGSPFAGLLASRDKGISLEAAHKQLPADGVTGETQQGFGVFAYYLVQALQAPNKVLPAPPGEPGLFVEFLGGRVSELTKKLDNREQRPIVIGKFGIIPVDWSKPGAPVKTGALLPRFAAFPGLFAFTGAFLPAGMAAQAAELSRGALLPQFLLAVADGNLSGEGGVAALLKRVRAEALAGFSPDERSRFAAGVEDAGQQVVARYGTGDQFPDDPRKVSRADFELAAELFAEARDLRLVELAKSPRQVALRNVCSQDIAADPDVLALEARRLFSAGRAALSADGDGVLRRGNPDEAAVHEAERLLRCAEELEPAMPEVTNALGIAELLLSRSDQNPEQRMDAATSRFRRAIQLSPNWAYPRHNLSLVYNEQGRFSLAEREIREAIQRTPYYPYLYYNLGLTLQRLNRLGEAERAYRDAVSVFDVQIGRYRGRADTWSDLPGRSQTAAKVAEALGRNRVEALNALGSLYVRRRKFQDAEKAYGDALKADEKHAPARHNLALLYLSTRDRGREEELKRKAEDLLRSNTDFYPSRLELAEILLAGGQAVEARKHYEVVLLTVADNVRARLGFASALESLGQTKDAVDVLKWQGGRENPAVQARLGTLLMKVGDRAAACAAFRSAEQLSRDRVTGSESRPPNSKAMSCDAPPR